jgi:hypothetical protein
VALVNDRQTWTVPPERGQRDRKTDSRKSGRADPGTSADQVLDRALVSELEV